MDQQRSGFSKFAVLLRTFALNSKNRIELSKQALQLVTRVALPICYSKLTNVGESTLRRARAPDERVDPQQAEAGHHPLLQQGPPPPHQAQSYYNYLALDPAFRLNAGPDPGF
jgi:hypothetical protein